MLHIHSFWLHVLLVFYKRMKGKGNSGPAKTRDSKLNIYHKNIFFLVLLSFSCIHGYGHFCCRYICTYLVGILGWLMGGNEKFNRNYKTLYLREFLRIVFPENSYNWILWMMLVTIIFSILGRINVNIFCVLKSILKS